MINPEALRDRARELRIELASLLEQCADELVRLRRPRRVISVGEDNPDD